MFFMDVFGRNEQFDSQINNSRKNYRYMVESNYKEQFFKTLEEGNGLNIMESLAMAMRARNLDKTNPDLYNNLIKYSSILKEKKSSNIITKGVLISLGALSFFVIALGALYKHKTMQNNSNQYQTSKK